MGISQLLPLLKPAFTQVPLSDFKGKRVGVDGNVWIHRGAYACALDLALGAGTDAFVKYCCALAALLVQHGVHPVVVFDGHWERATQRSGHAVLRCEDR